MVRRRHCVSFEITNIKDSRASVVDLGMSQVVDGDVVKVFSWYHNV